MVDEREAKFLWALPFVTSSLRESWPGSMVVFRRKDHTNGMLRIALRATAGA